MPIQSQEPTHPHVWILVEKLADQRFVEGMFRQEVQAGAIAVEPCFTPSGITSAAQRALLDARGEFVVLLMNAETDEPAALEEEVRAPVQRMLGQISPTGWHLAIAAPRLDAWAMADQRIAQAFADAQAARGPQSYKERSIQFEQLTDVASFDRGAAAGEFAEFKALSECLMRHIAQPGEDQARAEILEKRVEIAPSIPRARREKAANKRE